MADRFLTPRNNTEETNNDSPERRSSAFSEDGKLYSDISKIYNMRQYSTIAGAPYFFSFFFSDSYIIVQPWWSVPMIGYPPTFCNAKVYQRSGDAC